MEVDFSKLDTDLTAELKKLEAEIAALEDIKRAILSPPSSFEDAVARNYIKTKSVKVTYLAVRDADIKKPNGTLYSTADVSAIIKASISTSSVGELVRITFSKNSAGVAKAGYN